MAKKLKKKQKLIEFIPASQEIEGIFDPPVPAATMLPSWYQRQGMYADGVKQVTDKGDFNHTVKACMPALDAMTSGYIIPLPQDVNFVQAQDGGKSCQWPSDVWAQISSHSLNQIDQYPLDTSIWSPSALKFNNPWIIKTPPGYSTLFIHPMWRDDLPFRCFPGIVDTDHYHINSVNFPFVVRADFFGIIEAGTPMIQAIPFKRENFISELVEESKPENSREWQKTRKSFGHRYKKEFRQKKEYK